MKDVIIIGGGVAGLMAAGEAAGAGLNVTLLEKMEKPARKLRITGKGRCNLTNIRPMDEFLTKITQGAEFAEYSLREFDSEATVKFVESIGVPLVTERGGRVYPTTGRAWDIAEAMISWAKKHGAEIICKAEVTKIEHTDTGTFKIHIQDRTMEAKSVIITTGGVSYPLTGSTGDGYQFAHDLGHSIIPLRPALVPLNIANISRYEGLSLKNVGVKLIVDEIVSQERFGDVDFTDKALGGATILQISRVAVDAIIEHRKVTIELDMKPALSDTKLQNRINREIEQMPTAPCKILLQKLVPAQLFTTIAEQSGLKLTKIIEQLTHSEIETITKTLKSLQFPIRDYRPFSEAIVTAGGISLVEVDPKTIQSRIVPNLYFAGEVLDIDADTGGFNIQIALSTARAAAQHVAESLLHS